MQWHSLSELMPWQDFRAALTEALLQYTVIEQDVFDLLVNAPNIHGTAAGVSVSADSYLPAISVGRQWHVWVASRHNILSNTNTGAKRVIKYCRTSYLRLGAAQAEGSPAAQVRILRPGS